MRPVPGDANDAPGSQVQGVQIGSGNTQDNYFGVAAVDRLLDAVFDRESLGGGTWIWRTSLAGGG